METQNGKFHTRKREILANPPIIEAILEIQWSVFKDGDRAPLNEKFKLLPGRLHEKVKNRYPVIEVLTNSAIPDEMNPNLPRFRFRSKEGNYPLIQIGPAVLTVNLDKTNFLSQDKFYETSIQALADLFSIIDVELTHIHLHYIDAFDYRETNLYDFLRRNLKLNFSFQPELFEKTKIPFEPDDFLSETSYQIDQPKGQFRCRLRKGKKPNNEQVILMDTICISQGADVPLKDKLGEWIIQADDTIHNWFYEMIKDYKELW
jgi:uncharacterized protein (TIGR04255 family)